INVATHAIIQDQGIPTANSPTEHTVDYEEDMELALNYVREHQSCNTVQDAEQGQRFVTESQTETNDKENLPPLSSLFPSLESSCSRDTWRCLYGTTHVLEPLLPPIDTDGQLQIRDHFVPIESNSTIINSNIYVETAMAHSQGKAELQHHDAQTNSSTSTVSVTRLSREEGDHDYSTVNMMSGCLINSTRLKPVELVSSNQRTYIWEPYREEVTMSNAYSSNYWQGYSSWPDLTLPTPQPSRPNKFKRWRSCPCIFLYITTLLTIWVTATRGQKMGTLEIAPQPMLCQTNKGGTLWRLPKLPPCHVNKDYKSSKMYTETMQLYKRNIIKYESKAYHCRKVYHEIQAFTYLFANRRLKKEKIIERPVGLEECKRMVKFKRCEHGLDSERWNVDD
ncbi:MAG: hypothetical protein GY816_16475, partial [Cytophagales bacterium]|nr:hypothetical protein [Cytophagales bacterium]